MSCRRHEDARIAAGKAIEFLQSFPFACRKAAPDQPFLREMVIECGQAGYVAPYEIENPGIVPVLAVHHQRESDFLKVNLVSHPCVLACSMCSPPHARMNRNNGRPYT